MDYNGLVELESTAVDSAAIGKGTFLLADNRDDKTYLVRRMADGNCWMVQNLDLNLADFAGTSNLTSENTNLNTKSSWNPSAKMLAKSTTLEGGQLVADYQFQDEHSFGSSLLWGSICQEGTGPLANVSPTVACTSISVANNRNAVYARSYNNDSATATSTGTGNGPAYIAGTQNINNATECAKITGGSQASNYCKMTNSVGDIGGTNTNNNLVRDSKWQPELITDYGGTLVNGSDTFTMRGSMYFGDYYNWYAATAETGTFASATAITDDICPKGWRLPVNAGGSDGSWTKLLRTTYGLEGDNYSQTSRGSIGKVMQLPLSIPMTGYYLWTNGALRDRGYNGVFWSSTGSSASGANYLGFYYYGRFYPQLSDNKLIGLTIRCVNKGSNQETVVSTCAANSICYNSNGGSGSMDNQSVTAAETPADTSAMLTAPSFTRTGYAFAGWSTSSTGYGTTYGPNETVTVGDLSSAGLQLYAKWIKSSGTMQEFTATQCAAMAEHEVIALTDNRDGNTYSVAKLKDGNCWMTSNLALNLAEFAGENPTKGYLTTENTDLSASRTDLIEVASTGAGNQSVKRWDPNDTVNEIGDYAYWDKRGANVWYSWWIATTGAYKYEHVNENKYKTPDSICPYGWQLPNLESAKSWESILNYELVGIEDNVVAKTDYIEKYPLSLTNIGYLGRSGGSIDRFGAGGLYWTNGSSSNAYDGAYNTAYALDFQDRYIINRGGEPFLKPSTGGYKRLGFSVRCVQRDAE